MSNRQQLILIVILYITDFTILASVILLSLVIDSLLDMKKED